MALLKDTKLGYRLLGDGFNKIFNRALFFQVFASLINYVTLVFVAKWLSTEDFGRYSTIFAYIQIGLVFIVLGLDKSAIQFIGQYLLTQQNNYIKGFYIYGMKLIFFIAVILFLGVGYLFFVIKLDIAVLLFLGILLVVLMGIKEFNLQFFRSLLHMEKAYGASLLLSILLFVFYFFLHQMNKDVLLYYLSAYVIVILSVIIYQFFLISRGSIQNFRVHKFNHQIWLKTSLSIMLISSSSIILGKMDIIYVNKVLGAYAAGVYGLAITLNRVLTFFLTSINSLLFPEILYEILQKKIHSAEKLMRLFVVVSGGFSGITIIVFLIVGKRLLLFIDENYLDVFTPTVILLFGNFVNVLVGPVGNILIHTGYKRICFGTYIFFILTTSFLFPLVAREFGLIGIALLVSLTIITINLWFMYIVKDKLGLRPFFSLLFR